MIFHKLTTHVEYLVLKLYSYILRVVLVIIMEFHWFIRRISLINFGHFFFWGGGAFKNVSKFQLEARKEN